MHQCGIATQIALMMHIVNKSQIKISYLLSSRIHVKSTSSDNAKSQLFYIAISGMCEMYNDHINVWNAI